MMTLVPCDYTVLHRHYIRHIGQVGKHNSWEDTAPTSRNIRQVTQPSLSAVKVARFRRRGIQNEKKHWILQ